MPATYDTDIVVNALTGAPAVKTKGFGLPLYAADDADFPSSKVRRYQTNPDAQNDPDLGPKAKAAAAAFFNVENHPPEVAIGQVLPDRAQIIQFTIMPGVGATDRFGITINGIESAYKALAGDDEVAVATAVRAEMTTNLTAEPVTVAGAGADILVTANTPGEAFGYASEYVAVNGTSGITEAIDTENRSIDTELSAIQEEEPAFYGLAAFVRDKATNLLAAAWAEANGVLFAAQTSDQDVVTDAPGNLFAELKAKSYKRTIPIWHAQDLEHKAMTWLSFKLAKNLDQGQTLWKFATLPGVTIQTINPTQKANILKHNGNVYLTLQGVGSTGPGTLANGEFVDQLTTRDWFRARAREATAQLMLDTSNRNEKVSFTDTGLAVLVTPSRALLGKGEKIDHFAPESTSLTTPKVTDFTLGQTKARKVSWSAIAVYSNAVQEAEFNMAILVAA